MAFIGCVLLGGGWALLTPLTAVPDEATHVIRAVSLWQGDLVGRRFVLEEGGARPVQATIFEVTTPRGFGLVGELASCYSGPEGGSAGCAPPLPDLEGTHLMGTIAGVYPPAPYVVYGWASRIASPTEAIYAGRLLAAVLAAAYVAAAVAAGLLVGGARMLTATLFAVTPVAVWLFGAINPSGIEVAASLALWTSTLALLRHPGRWWVAGVFAAAATGVAASRPLSPLMAVGIIVTAVVLAGDRTSVIAAVRSRPARVALGAGFLSVAASVGWVVATDALSTFIARPDASLTPGVAALGSWEATPWRVRQMVGVFGVLDTRAPEQVMWVWRLGVATVIGAGLWAGTWRQRTVVIALLAGVVALPILAEVTTAAELGYTWQGRYTMPVAAGVLVASGWALSHGQRAVPRFGLLVLGVGVMIAGTFGHSLSALATTARFARGQGTGLFGWLDDAPWSPPGPDAVILGAIVAGALLLLASPLVADLRERREGHADADHEGEQPHHRGRPSVIGHPPGAGGG